MTRAWYWTRGPLWRKVHSRALETTRVLVDGLGDMDMRKGQHVVANGSRAADDMSFEELLACPHLQFDVSNELLPHLVAFAPPSPPEVPSVTRFAPDRRRWLFHPVADTTVTC
jgi:hypothetical protein